MSEKRYFKIEYDEEWYLFDSTTISEQLVKEQAEYGYGVFANSLSPLEILDLLNEQQATIDKLDQENADLLGARIKAQEDWEKCTDKLKAKILEQQATIDQLNLAIDDLLSHTSCDEIKKENEQLRQSIDSMIETSAEISNRNVLLHEQLGETQFNHKQCEKKVKELEQKLDWICEQTGFDGVKFHYINKEVVQ